MAVKQVFGNDFISEMIYDFCDLGRETHQRLMDQNRDHLLVDSDVFDELQADFYYVRFENWMRHDDTHFVTYLQETYDEEELRQYSLQMKWCRCCSRHSHYKNVPYKPADPLPESKGVYKNGHLECACKCRHLYRMFKSNGLA